MTTPSLLTTSNPAPVDFSKISYGKVPNPIATPAAKTPTASVPSVTSTGSQPTYTASGGVIIPSVDASAAIAGIQPDTPVDVGSLTSPAAPVKLPSLPTPQTPNYQNVTITNTAAQDALDNEKEQLKSGITADTTKLGTKAARQGQLETEAGVPGLNKQLNEINNQIRQTQSESLDAYNKSEGRKAPTFAIQGEQAQIERLRAAKVFGLSAAAEALQGNISLANDQVTRALDAEFGGIQADIDNKKYLLTLNMDSFNTEEKRAAEARQTELDKEKDAVAQARQEKSDILKVMLQAAAGGADNATLSKIQNAKTAQEATALAGTTLADTQTQVVEAGGRQLLIDSKTGKTIADLGASKSALDGAGTSFTVQTAEDLTKVMGNSKVSATAKTTIGNLLGVITSAESLATSNPNGSFSGFYPGAGIVHAIIPTAFKKTETIKNEGLIDAINLRIQQWASGASLTKQQIEMVNKLVPQANDSDRVVQTKLNNLVNTMNNYIGGTLASEGISYSPAPVDLFASQKSLADIFNE